jgi:ABC-type multidrug transport system fused ATPase/permease subunit
MSLPPFPRRPVPFLLHHVRRHPWLNGGVLTTVLSAAMAAVAVQYGMKLLIDRMTAAGGPGAEVWIALAIFVGLICLENALWRVGGWLGSRSVILTGVDIRLGLFTHLGGHGARYWIPAGQRVGVLGSSGAGKSTLVGLVQRLDEVRSGRLRIDGQPITAMTQDNLRRAIAVVPQDLVLFHRTVMENIRYGRPEASEEEVVGAARAARCDGFIRQLPQGYGSLVGERGVKLSGGQRQRIGIARAILRDAPIMPLDEATSSLDRESEMAVQRALAVALDGRTVVAVAHRLSTIAAFDRVIVLEDGRIVEDGPPAELLQRNGPFAAMWRLQSARQHRQAEPGRSRDDLFPAA